MKFNLSVDPEQLTVDDLIFFEENTRDLASATLRIATLKKVLARFVCDENGKCLDNDAAEKAVGGLTISELKQSVSALTDAMKRVKEQAVPPTNGSVS